MDSSISRGSFPDEEDYLGLQHNRKNGNAGKSEDITIVVEKAIKGMLELTRFSSSNVGASNYLESESVDQEECDVFGENRDAGINVSSLSKSVGVAHNVQFDTDHQYGYTVATAKEIRLGNEICVNDCDSSVRKDFIDKNEFIIDSYLLDPDYVSTEEVLDIGADNRGQVEHVSIGSLNDTRKLNDGTVCFNNNTKNDSVEVLPSPDKCANVQHFKEDNRTIVKPITNSSKNSDVNRVVTTSSPTVYKGNLPQPKNLSKGSLKYFYESIAPNLADDDKNEDKMPVLVNENDVVVSPSEEDRPPPELTPENNAVNEQVIGVVHPFNHENNLNIDNQVKNISGIPNNRKPLNTSTEIITRNRLRSNGLYSVINAPRRMIKKQESYRTVILKHDGLKTMAIPTFLNGSVDKSDCINKEVNIRQGISSGNLYRIAGKGIKPMTNVDIKDLKNVNEFPLDSRLPIKVQIQSINKVPEIIKFPINKLDYDEEAFHHVAAKSCNTQNEVISNGQPIVPDNIRKTVSDDQEIMKNNKSNTCYNTVCNVKADKIVANEENKGLRGSSPISMSILPSMPTLLSPTREETHAPIIKSNYKGKADHKNIGREQISTRSTATPLRSFQRLPIKELSLIPLNANKKAVLKHKKNSKQNELVSSGSVTNVNTVFPKKEDMHNDIKTVGLEEYRHQSEIDSNSRISHFSLNKNKLNEEITKSVMQDDLNKKLVNNVISTSLETLTIDIKETDSSFKTFDNLLTELDLDNPPTNSLESVHSLDPFIKDPTADILGVSPDADVLDGGIADEEIIISSDDVSILKSDMLEEGPVLSLEDGPTIPFLNIFDEDLNSSKIAESQQNDPKKFSNKSNLSFTIPEIKYEEDKTILERPKDKNINDETSSVVENNILINNMEEVYSKTKSEEVGCLSSNDDQLTSEVLDNDVTFMNKQKVFPFTIPSEQKEYDDSKNSLFSEIEKIDQILERELANSIDAEIISDKCSKSPSLPSSSSTREENQDLNENRTADIAIENNFQEHKLHEKSKLSEDRRVSTSKSTMGSCVNQLNCKEVDLKPDESSGHPEQSQIIGNYSIELKNILGTDGNTIDTSMSDKKQISDTLKYEDNDDNYLEDISDGDLEVDEDLKESKLSSRNNLTAGRNAAANYNNSFYKIRTNVAHSSQKHVSLQREVTKCHGSSNTKFSKDSSSFNMPSSAFKNNNTYRRKDATQSFINSPFRKRTRVSKKHDINSLKPPKKGNISSSLQKGKQGSYSGTPKKHDSCKQFGSTFSVMNKMSVPSDKFNIITNRRVPPPKSDGNDLPCRRHKTSIINIQDNICKRMQEDKASFSNIKNKGISLSQLENSDYNQRNNLPIISLPSSKSSTIKKTRNEDGQIVGGPALIDDFELSKECVNVKSKQKEKKAGLEDIVKKLKSEKNASDDKWHTGEKMDSCNLKSDENSFNEPENFEFCCSKIETEIIHDNLDDQLEMELNAGKNNSIFHKTELINSEYYKDHDSSSSIEKYVSDPAITPAKNLPASNKKEDCFKSISLTNTSAGTDSLTNADVGVDYSEKVILSSEKSNYIPSTSSALAYSDLDSSPTNTQGNLSSTENKQDKMEGELSSSVSVSKNSESKSIENGVDSLTNSEFVTDKICTSGSECDEKDIDLIKTNENFNESHVLNEIETEKLNECVTTNEVNADSNSCENEIKNCLSKSSVSKNPTRYKQKSMYALINKSSPLLNHSCGNDEASEIIVDLSCQKTGVEHKKKGLNSETRTYPGVSELVTENKKKSFMEPMEEKKCEVVCAAATRSCRQRERNNCSLTSKKKSETENISISTSDTAAEKKQREDKDLSENCINVTKTVDLMVDVTEIASTNDKQESISDDINGDNVSEMTHNPSCVENVPTNGEAGIGVTEKTFTESLESVHDDVNIMNVTDRTNQIINIIETTEVNEKTFFVNNQSTESVHIDVDIEENGVNVTKMTSQTNVTVTSNSSLRIENLIPDVRDIENSINETEQKFTKKLESLEISDDSDVIDVIKTASEIIDDSEKTESSLKSSSIENDYENPVDGTVKIESLEGVNNDDTNIMNVIRTTNQITDVSEETGSTEKSLSIGNDKENLIDSSRKTFTEKLQSLGVNDDINIMNIVETTNQITVASEKTKTTEKAPNIVSDNLTVCGKEKLIDGGGETLSGNLQSLEGINGDKNIMNAIETKIQTTDVSEKTESSEKPPNIENDNLSDGDNENLVDRTKKTFTRKLQSLEGVNDDANVMSVIETANQIDVTATTDSSLCIESVIPTVSDDNGIGDSEKLFTGELKSLENVKDNKTVMNVIEKTNQTINVTEKTKNIETLPSEKSISLTVSDAENLIDDTGKTFTRKLRTLESVSDDNNLMNVSETVNEIIDTKETTESTEKLQSIENVIPGVCDNKNGIHHTDKRFPEELRIENIRGNTNGLNVIDKTNQVIDITEKIQTTDGSFSVNNASSEKLQNMESVIPTVNENESDINITDKTFTEITKQHCVESINSFVSGDENSINATENTDKTPSLEFVCRTNDKNDISGTKKTYTECADEPFSIKNVNEAVSNGENCISTTTKTFTENIDRPQNLYISDQTITDDENINVTETIFSKNAGKQQCIESINPSVSDDGKVILDTLPFESNSVIANEKSGIVSMNVIECNPGLTSELPLLAINEDVPRKTVEPKDLEKEKPTELINSQISGYKNVNGRDESRSLKLNDLITETNSVCSSDPVHSKFSSLLIESAAYSGSSKSADEETAFEKPAVEPLIDNLSPPLIKIHDETESATELNNLKSADRINEDLTDISSEVPRRNASKDCTGTFNSDEIHIGSTMVISSLGAGIRYNFNPKEKDVDAVTNVNINEAEADLAFVNSKIEISSEKKSQNQEESTKLENIEENHIECNSIVTKKNKRVSENSQNNCLSPSLVTSEASIHDRHSIDSENNGKSEPLCDVSVKKVTTKAQISLQGSDSQINNHPDNFTKEFAKYIDQNNRSQIDGVVEWNESPSSLVINENSCESNNGQSYSTVMGSGNSPDIDQGNKSEEKASEINRLKQKFPSFDHSAIDNTKPSVGTTDFNLSADINVKLIECSEMTTDSSKSKVDPLPVDDCCESEVVKHNLQIPVSEDELVAYSTLSSCDLRNVCPSENQPIISNHGVTDHQVSLQSEALDNCFVQPLSGSTEIEDSNLDNISTSKMDLQLDISINKLPSDKKTEESTTEHSNYPVTKSFEEQIIIEEENTKGQNADNPSEQENVMTRNRENSCPKNSCIMAACYTEEQLKSEDTEESSVILEHSPFMPGSNNLGLDSGSYIKPDANKVGILQLSEVSAVIPSSQCDATEIVPVPLESESNFHNSERFPLAHRSFGGTKPSMLSVNPFDSNLSDGNENKPQYTESSKSNIDPLPEEIYESEVADSNELSPQSNLTCQDCTEPNSGSVENSEKLKKLNSELIENENLNQAHDSDDKQGELSSNVIVANCFQSSTVVKSTSSKIPLLEKTDIDKIVVNECGNYGRTEFAINLEKTPRVLSKNEVIYKVQENDIVSSSMDQSSETKIINLKLDKQDEVNKVDIIISGTSFNIETNGNHFKKMGHNDSVSRDAEITDESVETNFADSVLSETTQEHTGKYVFKEVKIILEKIDLSSNSSNMECAANVEIKDYKRKRQILGHSESIKRSSNTPFDEEEPPKKILLFDSPQLVDDDRSLKGGINSRSKSRIPRRGKTEVSAGENHCPTSNVLLSRLNSFGDIRECMHKNKIKKVFIPSNIYNCFKEDICQPSVYSDLEIICSKSTERNTRFKRRRRKSPLSRTDDESDNENCSSKNQLERPRRLNKKTKKDKGLNRIESYSDFNKPSLLSVKNEKSANIKSLSESLSIHERTVLANKRHHEPEKRNEELCKRPNLNNKGPCSYNKPEIVNYLTIKPVVASSSGHLGVLKVGESTKQILHNVAKKRLIQAVGAAEDEEDSDDDFMGFEDELPCGCSLKSNSINRSCTGNCFVRRVKVKLCYLNRTIKLSSKHSSSRRNERFRTFRPSRQESGEEQDYLRGNKSIELHQEASASSKPFRDPGICFMSGVRNLKNKESFKLIQGCLRSSELVTSKNVEVTHNKRTRRILSSSVTETDKNEQEDSDSSS